MEQEIRQYSDKRLKDLDEIAELRQALQDILAALPRPYDLSGSGLDLSAERAQEIILLSQMED